MRASGSAAITKVSIVRVKNSIDIRIGIDWSAFVEIEDIRIIRKDVWEIVSKIRQIQKGKYLRARFQIGLASPVTLFTVPWACWLPIRRHFSWTQLTSFANQVHDLLRESEKRLYSLRRVRSRQLSQTFLPKNSNFRLDNSAGNIIRNGKEQSWWWQVSFRNSWTWIRKDSSWCPLIAKRVKNVGECVVSKSAGSDEIISGTVSYECWR